MMAQTLEVELTRILNELGWPAPTDLVRTAANSRHGHYQSNLGLRLAKELGQAPHTIAQSVADKYSLDAFATLTVERGFLNFKLTEDALIQALSHASVAPLSPSGKTVVVDYSSPNVAKAMHVGHLRSTVIGDSLARIAGHQGHTVIRQNHLGDWGTQFGMLIELYLESSVFLQLNDLDPLTKLYREAKERFDLEPDFADRARRRVVALQAGDPQTREIWRGMVLVSLQAFQAVYDRMGISLKPEDVMGESRYNAGLANRVNRLAQAGILAESDGALCYFSAEFKAKDGSPLSLILRKADGGYGYAATDIEALCHRVWQCNADEILYVVDSRQALHFEQVFSLGHYSTLLPKSVNAVHVGFGTVLGEDNRPFKTRSGETVSLESLLDAAEEAAFALIEAKDLDLVARGYAVPSMPQAERARLVSLAAIKYADLFGQRHKDYVFAVDRMVRFEGNTGPYLQYMHARLASVLRRAGGDEEMLTLLSTEEKQNLALLITGFAAVVEQTSFTHEPHHLAGYLFSLATAVATFYESCQILKAEGEVKASRLALTRAAKDVLAAGLDLLGIEALEEM